jgi:hypothetical protein
MNNSDFYINTRLENAVFIYMNKRSNSGCPSLVESKSEAMEQLLNAIILNNHDNITDGIHLAITAENYYFKLQSNHVNTIDLIDEILSNLPNSGVTLKDFNHVREHNLSIHLLKNFSNFDKKQKYINDEFESDYKLSFNGNERFRFNPTYYEYIGKIMFERTSKSLTSYHDKFIYDYLEPEYQDILAENKNIIEQNLNKYIEKIRNQKLPYNSSKSEK